MSANDTNEDDNDKTVEASHYSVEIKIIVEFNHWRSYQCWAHQASVRIKL